MLPGNTALPHQSASQTSTSQPAVQLVSHPLLIRSNETLTAPMGRINQYNAGHSNDKVGYDVIRKTAEHRHRLGVQESFKVRQK